MHKRAWVLFSFWALAALTGNAATDRQLQAAGAGAISLKKAAKDPATFDLSSAVVHADGAACYEYRGKNSYGAVLPGQAVLLPTGGKLLARERDGNTFVRAWNQFCTRPGGNDIAPLMRREGMI